jgi:biotin carboxyl carrier protein
VERDERIDMSEQKPRRSSGATRAMGGATAYVVSIGGQETTVEIGPEGVRAGGVDSVVAAELLEVPGSPIRLLRLGDAVYEVIARRGSQRGAYSVGLGGVRLNAEALDQRGRALRALSAATATRHGPEPIRAPMPGLVTRVLVAAGDAVRAGDSIVVMEAMKMENELRARSDGKVRAVVVTPGTAVEKGMVLVELE